MDAVGQAAGRDVGDRGLKVVVFAADGRPAVDHQEHVAPSVGGRGGRRWPAAPVGGHAVDAGLGEAPLPVVEQRRDLADRAADRGRVEPAGDPADVWQVPQAEQLPAAEVEAVHLDLGGRVGQGEPEDQRAQRHRLAALRAADDGDVPVGAVEVEPQHVAALQQRLVDERDRHLQRPAQPGVGDAQAAARLDRDRAEQLVDRRRRAQRRQPHLVRGDALADQPVDEDVEQAPGRLIRG